MRLILKGTILSLTLFIFSLILAGCVDEPTIEQPHRLNSVIRVVNLSNNEDNIRVTIADQIPNPAMSSMAMGTGTDFFDIPAGKKSLKVYDQGGQLLYSKDVEIASLELTSIFVAGQYDTDELLNTFNVFELAEGETYVSHAPAAGTSVLYMIHASAAVDTFNSDKYTVGATYTVDGIQHDTTYNSDTPLEYTQTLGTQLFPTSYSFKLTTEDSVTTNVDPVQIEAGYRYYMYIYGNPNNVRVVFDKLTPPSIRSRD